MTRETAFTLVGRTVYLSRVGHLSWYIARYDTVRRSFVLRRVSSNAALPVLIGQEDIMHADDLGRALADSTLSLAKEIATC